MSFVRLWLCFSDSVCFFITNVIGFVTSVGFLEEFCLNAETKNQIRLTLADEEWVLNDIISYTILF